jgi:hypothetical protein
VIRSAQPGRGPGRRPVGHAPQQLVTEPGQHRDQRRYPREQRRSQLTTLAVPADLALLYMPANPLAHEHRQLPVPARQHGVESGTRLPAGPRHDQRPEGPFQLAAGPRQQRVRVVARHSEHVGQILTLELVAQAQLDDIPLARVQPVDRVPDQFVQVRSLRLAAHAPRLGRQVGRLLEPRGDVPGPKPPQAFVARDRVEPGTELSWVTKTAKLGGGDEERVLYRVGGIGRLAQHGTAVGVERHRVPVVRLGEPVRVTEDDGRDDLRVFHAGYGSSPSACGSGGMRKAS